MTGQGGDLRRADDLPDVLRPYVVAVAAAMRLMANLRTYTCADTMAHTDLDQALTEIDPDYRRKLAPAGDGQED